MDNNFIETIKQLNLNKSYYILTMGCQLNENDSEKLAGMFEKMGFYQASEMENADIAIINTCCVRENAEEKVFGKLGELKKIKEKREIIIGICGCMMQEEVMREKIKRSYPFVDIVFGTHTIHKFPEDLYKTITEQEKIIDILDIDGQIHEGLPIKRNHTKQQKECGDTSHGKDA